MIFNCDYIVETSPGTQRNVFLSALSPFPGNIPAVCQKEHDFSHALGEGLPSCNGLHLRLPSFPRERTLVCCSWVGSGVGESPLANPQRAVCKCQLWARLSQELVNDCCSHTRSWCLELRLGSCGGFWICRSPSACWKVTAQPVFSGSGCSPATLTLGSQVPDHSTGGCSLPPDTVTFL